MSKFEVEFYERDTGEQPAKDFLLSLDKKNACKNGRHNFYFARQWI